MTTQRKKVLLINGDILSTRYITNNLSGSHNFFEIESFDRLASGLARLDRGGVDIALLDLSLPDGNGLEAIRRTRAKAPQLPIVALAADEQKHLSTQAVHEGAQDFLIKDRTVSTLLVRSLEHAIERKREEDRLRESESRYKQLLASVSDYVYTVRIENGSPLASTHGAGCTRVTGYTPFEFERDPYLWYRMIHPEDQQRVLSYAEKLLTGECPPPLEHRIIHKDGTERWVRNVTVPSRDPDGKIRSYDGIVADVTMRNNAMAALLAVEERYQLVVDRNLAGIMISTISGKILQCNESFARMLGYSSPGEMEQQCATDFYFDPADREVIVARLRAQGALTNYEFCMRAADGRPVWILANITLTERSHGEPILFGTAVDISIRRAAERALKDSEAIYSSLVNNIPLLLFRKDISGRFTFANQRFCASLGQSLDNILGKTDYDFYPPELAEKYRRDDRHVIASGEVFETTESNISPDGQRTYVAVVKTPVYAADKTIIGIQGMFWDATEHKWAEAQKEQLYIARAIQQKLLPIQAPSLPGFDIGGSTQPAEATGGDFFDYIAMAEKSLGIAVADVSGHGFGPALVGAATHACLRTVASLGRGVGMAQMLSAANSLLFEDTAGEPYVTLIFAHLDPRTRTLAYSNAGHPPGYVLDAEGTVKHRLASTSTFLGIFPEAEFATGAPVQLESGDIVVLYTDGILEATAPDGTMFGKDRLLESVRMNRRRSAQGIVDALCKAARDFYQGELHHDDLTVVIIKVTDA